MKEQNIKRYNMKEYRPRILLIGNGLMYIG